MLEGFLSFLFKAGFLFGGLLVFILVFLFFFQNKMLYIPEAPYKLPSQNPPPYRSPDEHGFTHFEDLIIKTSDGETLHGWFFKTESSTNDPTVIYFHENAGNIGTRLPFVKMYQRYVKCNVALVAYRGYSYSTGSPSEQGLQLDAEAVLDHIFSRKDIDRNRVLVHGRSLGGAVSIYITSQKKHPVSALILENTFLSIANMVDAIFPKLAPLKGLVLRNFWPSVDRIGEIEIPIFFIVSMKDEIVPAWHVLRLRDKAKKAQYTEIHQIAEGNHNGGWAVDVPLYFGKVAEFVKKAGVNH
mmetsp:Transcript_22926/g.26609  ORF Transcript_22926/g.26609 Transcript_22926/m.26609 type:complete len:299 (-) Transcript_22926:53-949(-)